MAALGTVFALLMGLTLASEASFLAAAQGIVSNEAADASRLACAATSPGLGDARGIELLAALDALTNDRRARLAAASHQLPVLTLSSWPSAGRR